MGYTACRGLQASRLQPGHNYIHVFNHCEESKGRNILMALPCHSHSEQLCSQRQIFLAYTSVRAGDPRHVSLKRLAMAKVSLKPWGPATCSQPPGQALLEGAKLWAGRRGSPLPSSSGTTSAALAPRVQTLSPTASHPPEHQHHRGIAAAPILL